MNLQVNEMLYLQSYYFTQAANTLLYSKQSSLSFEEGHGKHFQTDASFSNHLRQHLHYNFRVYRHQNESDLTNSIPSKKSLSTIHYFLYSFFLFLKIIVLIFYLLLSVLAWNAYIYCIQTNTIIFTHDLQSKLKEKKSPVFSKISAKRNCEHQYILQKRIISLLLDDPMD